MHLSCATIWTLDKPKLPATQGLCPQTPRTTRTLVELTDDIDAGDADETMAFSLDGNAYEIDMSKANAHSLREVIAPHVGHASKAAGDRGGKRSSIGSRSGGGASKPPTGSRTADIRAWPRGRASR